MSAENEFFVPATDIVEMEDGVHIFMDLPGVGADSLSIDLEEDEVTIRGESRYVSQGGGRTLHSEFQAVNFQRTFTLSDMVERDQITASLKDGVLNLFLPKAEAMKPRRIPITGA